MICYLKSLNIFAVAFVLLTGSGSCKQVNMHLYTSEVDSISKKWVPDKREGICSTRLYRSGNNIVLSGSTNIPDAKKDIVHFLESEHVKFLDSLLVIPDTNKIKEPWGLIDVSVCNIRHDPGHEKELISQALMGTPVRILSEENGWLKVQTPDSYIGWIDEDAVSKLTSLKYAGWKRSSRIIFLDKTGDIFAGPEDHSEVSDIVAGVILETTGKDTGYYRVLLPDKRAGYLPEKSCKGFYEWAADTKPEADKIIKTAKSLMGTPYLWGGTSVKGLDCSGFIKTVYFLNGLVLARDASLQVKHGLEIKDHRDLENLKPGDLLFFGWNKGPDPDPTHVGMFIGNTEFIHESGMVKINSLDSTRKNFSKYRHDSFLAARRIIEVDPGPGMQMIFLHRWYF
jgi:gamma-D-glutamyl-L-lysine dipeptidyl-peptidase